MRNFLIFLIVLLSQHQVAYSQLSLAYNRIRPGDKLIKYQVEFKDPGSPGENRLWDFSQLKTINEQYPVTYSSPELLDDSLFLMGSNVYPATGINDSDLVIAREHHTQYFFRFKGDTLFLLGHENPLAKLEYSPPYLQTIFPLNYGEITSYPYHARGMYSQIDSISTEGLVTTLADAYGRMILPSGDTLQQVLRVRTLQSVVDCDTATHIQQKVLETCRWYTRGYRYPVFETACSYNNSDSTTYFKTAFYFPPQDHYYLDNDPANAAILEELWNIGHKNNQNGNKSDSQSRGFSIPGLLNCKLYPNPVITQLNINYEVTAKADVAFGIYSVEGFLIDKIAPKTHEPGIYSVTFDCSSLFPRNYIVRVTANDKMANELLLKK